MTQPTRQELGTLLEAIGRQMRLHDLSFGAVFDGHSKDSMLNDMTIRLEQAWAPASQRAAELLAYDEDEVLALLQETP